MPKFIDNNGKEVKEDEVTILFMYEDFLKQVLLEKKVGRLTLNHLRNETLKKIYVVPTGN